MLLEVAIVVVLVTYAAIWMALKLERTVSVAFVAAFVTLPAFVPTVLPVGGVEIQAFEPVLFGAAAWALATRRGRLLDGPVLALFALLIFGSALGIYASNDPAKMIVDLRPLAHLVAAAIVAARVVGTATMGTLERLLPRLLWFSAGVTLLAAITGFAVNGRTEVASLTINAVDGPARLLTPASYLAVAVVCACGALAIARLKTLRSSAHLLAPALVLVLLSFSRNNLLSIAAAAIFALAATRQARSVAFAIWGAAGAALAIGLIVLAQPMIASLPGGAFVSQQIDGYSARVVAGLSGEALSTDSSVLYRDIESNFIRPKIEERPVTGHGFGAAYRPPAGSEGFFLNSAPYYAHNYYLWLTFKTGLLGVALFAFAFVPPLARTLRRGGPETGPASALVGLLVASVVAPMPNGTPGSVLVGALLGLTIAMTQPRAKVANRPRRSLRTS